MATLVLPKNSEFSMRSKALNTSKSNFLAKTNASFINSVQSWALATL